MLIKIMFFSLLCFLLLDYRRKTGDRKLQRVLGRRKEAGGLKVLEKAGERLARYFNREKVELKLRQAGRPLGLTPEVYFTLKVLLPLLMLLTQIQSHAGLTYRGAMILAAFLLPDIPLQTATARRKKAIAAELPEIVDIFEAASSAGIETGHVFQLAAEFAGKKELKKELVLLAAGYHITKDKEGCLQQFRDNIGLYDTDVLTLALLQGDITGKTRGMLEALASVQGDNVLAKIQRDSKAVEYKVLFSCILMAFSVAFIYLYPYFATLNSGLMEIFR